MILHLRLLALPIIHYLELDLPIALRKGQRLSITHPLSHFVTYDKLIPSFRRLALSLSSVSIPILYQKAVLVHIL